jgi:hypothetical protein
MPSEIQGAASAKAGIIRFQQKNLFLNKRRFFTKEPVLQQKNLFFNQPSTFSRNGGAPVPVLHFIQIPHGRILEGRIPKLISMPSEIQGAASAKAGTLYILT